jgi:hypothetical protein
MKAETYYQTASLNNNSTEKASSVQDVIASKKAKLLGSGSEDTGDSVKRRK